jgi:hypothetical protein
MTTVREGTQITPGKARGEVQMYVDDTGVVRRMTPGAGGGGGTGDASAANQTTQITAANLTNTNLGGVTEAAPASDTASSGLNGRLQRIAQNLTSLASSVSTASAQTTTNTEIGAVAEVAPASDTASSGLNGRLQRVAQNITTLSGSVSTAANQSTLNTSVGATNEVAPASDTASSGLNGRLQRVAQRVTSLIGLFPASLGQKTAANSFSTVWASDAAIPAGEAHIGQIGGTSITVSGTFTRPADTTAYTAGDSVSNSASSPTVNSISGCVRINAGTGLLVKAVLVDLANQATAGLFEVWVFTSAYTLTNDNAANAFANTDLSSLVTIIPLTTSYVGKSGSGSAGNRVYVSDTLNASFKCAPSSTTLYWGLIVRNAYTPISSEQFNLILNVVAD